jgi:hypothetical protein
MVINNDAHVNLRQHVLSNERKGLNMYVSWKEFTMANLKTSIRENKDNHKDPWHSLSIIY